MHDWVLGSNGKWVTMGVPSDGSYGIPEGVVFGFPVITENGKYTIVKDLRSTTSPRSTSTSPWASSRKSAPAWPTCSDRSGRATGSTGKLRLPLLLEALRRGVPRGGRCLPRGDVQGGNAVIGLHYIDEALLVAEKPAGLLSVPGRLPEGRDCWWHACRRRIEDVLTVHRLDQVTSGLMLYARGKQVQAALSMQFEQRRVHKRYEAVVEGQVAGEAGEIALPLICDWPNRPGQMVDLERGKPALTRWRVLARDAGQAWTRVELEPVTGRSLAAAARQCRPSDRRRRSVRRAARAARTACVPAGLRAPAGETMTFVSPSPF